MIFVILAIFVAMAIIGYILAERTCMTIFDVMWIVSIVCATYAFVAIFIIPVEVKSTEVVRWWLYFG